MSCVALVIIYNHQYNKNIEILERIYKERFSNIYHLVPFYNGTKSNVIAVYDNSYYFQGYVAQGFQKYFKEEYEHYFFIGDDLLLNPAINENNYKDQMKLNANTCFIPRLSSIDEAKTFWIRNIETLLYFRHFPGVEVETQLPEFEEAEKLLKKFGIINKPLDFSQVWQRPVSIKNWIDMFRKEPAFILRFLRAQITKRTYNVSYPMVRSYSDIFVISNDAIKSFCHYCGVFAATRLFVELALPTALVFSAKEIVTEKDISYKGRALWTASDFAILDEYENNFTKLLESFPENYLYIHPVKLSKWVL